MAKKKKARKKKATPKKKKALRGKKTSRRKKRVRRKRPQRASTTLSVAAPLRKGLGPNAGGQSGDVQGLSEDATADSESVSELAEEGQEYEAEVVSGVENAPDADRGPVRTRQVREDDVPPEYLEKD
jgi:hypothetical protein